MSEARLEYLTRLFQHLQENQSEDCLYLNIYTPQLYRNLYNHFKEKALLSKTNNVEIVILSKYSLFAKLNINVWSLYHVTFSTLFVFLS